MDILTNVLAAFGLSGSAGLNAYLPLLVVALAARYTNLIQLKAPWDALESPWVIGALAVLLAVEFFADKIPGLDSLWDAVHTFIRIPAGMALAAAVFGGDSAVWTTIGALLGGTLAATSHVAKATTRAAVNTSPEPFSNVAVSLLGDAAVPTMLWLAWTHPAWFFVALAIALALMVGVTVLLFKFLRALLRSLRARLGPAGA